MRRRRPQRLRASSFNGDTILEKPVLVRRGSSCVMKNCPGTSAVRRAFPSAERPAPIGTAAHLSIALCPLARSVAGSRGKTNDALVG